MTFIQSSGVLNPGYGFNFTNIPQGFTHLQVRIFGRSNASEVSSLVYARPNADTSTSNYRSHFLAGNGSSATSSDWGTGRNYLFFGGIAGATSTASSFGCVIIDILDFSSTVKNKTFRAISGNDSNGSGNVYLYSGVWLNTAAMTSLEIGGFGWDFQNGSRLDLYGITVSSQTGA